MKNINKDLIQYCISEIVANDIPLHDLIRDIEGNGRDAARHMDEALMAVNSCLGDFNQYIEKELEAGACATKLSDLFNAMENRINDARYRFLKYNHRNLEIANRLTLIRAGMIRVEAELGNIKL